MTRASRIPIATGIANIWARDAMAMAAAQKTLAEAYPDRFLLGIGVSHAPLVQGMRGHHYRRPLSAMRAYLDAMDTAPFLAVPPAHEPERVIGALAPKMLAPSASRISIFTLSPNFRNGVCGAPASSVSTVRCSAMQA